VRASWSNASPGAGTAVDVYSFGVCLWEMCVRTYPWHDLLEAGRVDELKRRVGKRAVRLDASSCPRAFRLILEACWRHDPHRRPSFAKLATLDLAGIGRGSAQAVRACRSLLWPDGPPGAWAGADLDAETSRVPSCESFSLDSFGSSAPGE